MKWKFWDKPEPPSQAAAVVAQADTSRQSWVWKAKPGAHERHLQRRCQNPLFSAARRVVTAADVADARRKDAVEVRDLMTKVGAINLPDDFPNNWNQYLAIIREEIDGLKKRTRQIGGEQQSSWIT